MRYFAFKIAALCILLPPVFYILSIASAEKHLKSRYIKKIEQIYAENTQILLKGEMRLQDVISKNIDQYLKNSPLPEWGVKIDILVSTKNKTILYPPFFDTKKEGGGSLHDSMQTASDNYILMKEGLIISVDPDIELISKLSIGMITFYILIFMVALYFYYRAGIKKSKREETNRLSDLQKEFENRLKYLSNDSEELHRTLQEYKKNLKKEKNRAHTNETEMIEEIILLENKLTDNLTHQQNQIEEIDLLKEKLKKIEKTEVKKTGKKAQTVNMLQKEFNELYKNVEINKRAISSFHALSDGIKNKCEKIIHQLNDDPSLVPVKRKVFLKKGGRKFFEIIFAYTGRIYYATGKEGKIEILALGTKKTQAKDLEFLDRV